MADTHAPTKPLRPVNMFGAPRLPGQVVPWLCPGDLVLHRFPPNAIRATFIDSVSPDASHSSCSEGKHLLPVVVAAINYSHMRREEALFPAAVYVCRSFRRHADVQSTQKWMETLPPEVRRRLIPFQFGDRSDPVSTPDGFGRSPLQMEEGFRWERQVWLDVEVILDVNLNEVSLW